MTPATLANGRPSCCGAIQAIDVPHTDVRVLDPTRRNARFAEARRGTRIAVNKLGETVMSVVVTIQGADHVVPPDWVATLEGDPSVLAFPRRAP